MKPLKPIDPAPFQKLKEHIRQHKTDGYKELRKAGFPAHTLTCYYVRARRDVFKE